MPDGSDDSRQDPHPKRSRPCSLNPSDTAIRRATPNLCNTLVVTMTTVPLLIRATCAATTARAKQDYRAEDVAAMQASTLVWPTDGAALTRYPMLACSNTSGLPPQTLGEVIEHLAGLGAAFFGHQRIAGMPVVRGGDVSETAPQRLHVFDGDEDRRERARPRRGSAGDSHSDLDTARDQRQAFNPVANQSQQEKVVEMQRRLTGTAGLL
jgi:hypothetical protein